MDQVHVLRHKILVEGCSIRQAMRDLGLSRNTVRKYLRESAPLRKETGERPRPVTARVSARIDELLIEWRTRTTPKQRITGARLHRQLREEGYSVGITTVRVYLREKRRRAAEVFIPLVYRPGEVAQVDFFEVTVERSGRMIKCWKFLLRLMYSGYDYVWLYERCDQTALLDGHVRAFSALGGVPARCVYDNLTAAVKRLLGSQRSLTERFTALSSHYLFEPCFARPGEGHDKGGVESRGQHIRLQHLVPVPRGDSLREISGVLLESIRAMDEHTFDEQGKSVAARWGEEQPRLRPLPEVAFQARRTVFVQVSSRATVQIEGATYSVPCGWARLAATAEVGVEDIRLSCRGEQHVYAKQSPGERRIKYRHYLPELAKKPQAVRQVAPELVSELGAPYEQLWQLLVGTHGGLEAGRVMAKVLGAVVKRGEEPVGEALRALLAGGNPSARGASEHDEVPKKRVPLQRVAVPEALRAYEVEAGRAADYDWLLLEGGWR